MAHSRVEDGGAGGRLAEEGAQLSDVVGPVPQPVDAERQQSRVGDQLAENADAVAQTEGGQPGLGAAEGGDGGAVAGRVLDAQHAEETDQAQTVGGLRRRHVQNVAGRQLQLEEVRLEQQHIGLADAQNVAGDHDVARFRRQSDGRPGQNQGERSAGTSRLQRQPDHRLGLQLQHIGSQTVATHQTEHGPQRFELEPEQLRLELQLCQKGLLAEKCGTSQEPGGVR